MRLYPDIPSARLGTLARDALLLIALVICAWLGMTVHDAVDQLAVLGEGVHAVGSKVPLVGGSIKHLGSEGEDKVHGLANLLGLLTFGVPSALVLGAVLPGRIAQIRRLTAAARVLENPGGAERRRLVAMRAAFSLPYGLLLRYTKDPLGDLAAERYDALVAAAMEDAGLRAGVTEPAPS